MVLGLSIAVPAVPSVYQCADTHRMALGFGIDLPSFRQASVYWLRSKVFMGLPWPKNTTGILDPLRCIWVRLREIEQQDLGVSPFFEHDSGGVDGFQRIARFERLAVCRKPPASHVQVGAPTGLQTVDSAVRTVQKRGVHEGILVDRHGSLAPVGRGDQPQPPALGRLVEMLLLVARRDAGNARLDPDLEKVRHVLSMIELAVQHALPRAHTLHVPRYDGRTVS